MGTFGSPLLENVMSKWSYCENALKHVDDPEFCENGMDRGEFTIEQIVAGEYDCPSCGLIQPVPHLSVTDILESFHERLIALESKK